MVLFYAPAMNLKTLFHNIKQKFSVFILLISVILVVWFLSAFYGFLCQFVATNIREKTSNNKTKLVVQILDDGRDVDFANYLSDANHNISKILDINGDRGTNTFVDVFVATDIANLDTSILMPLSGLAKMLNRISLFEGSNKIIKLNCLNREYFIGINILSVRASIAKVLIMDLTTYCQNLNGLKGQTALLSSNVKIDNPQGKTLPINK